MNSHKNKFLKKFVLAKIIAFKVSPQNKTYRFPLQYSGATFHTHYDAYKMFITPFQGLLNLDQFY